MTALLVGLDQSLDSQYSLRSLPRGDRKMVLTLGLGFRLFCLDLLRKLPPIAVVPFATTLLGTVAMV